MDDRIRFHLDEHVDPAIAKALRSAGIDVTTTNEAGLRTKDDRSQLDFARAENRVIVTRDTDFLRSRPRLLAPKMARREIFMRAQTTMSKVLILTVLLLSTVIAVLVSHHRRAAIPDAKGDDDPRIGENVSGSAALPEEATLPEEYEVYSAVIAQYFQARPQRSPHPPDEKLTLVQVSNITLPNETWHSKDVPAELQAGTIEDYLANNKSPSLLTDHFNLPAGPHLAGHVLVDGRELQYAMDYRGSDAWIKFFARTLPSSHPENEHMIVQFSRVGFNRNMDQAVVFEIRYCGAVLSKGGYRFMVKDSGRWKLKASFGVFHNGC